MKIDNDLMLEAGKNSTQGTGWTYEQLDEIILGTELVLSYLKGRGDCGLLAYAIGRDLEKFREFKLHREIRSDAEKLFFFA